MDLSPEKKIAGILVPLFALRGENDLGIGDVAALREFIEWAGAIGFGLVDQRNRPGQQSLQRDQFGRNRADDVAFGSRFPRGIKGGGLRNGYEQSKFDQFAARLGQI